MKAVESTQMKDDEDFKASSNRYQPSPVKRPCFSNTFHFNLMFAGEQGLGKTTLWKTLYDRDNTASVVLEEATTEIMKQSLDIKLRDEPNTNDILQVTLYDTPGYGSSPNLLKSIYQIEEFVDGLLHKADVSTLMNPTSLLTSELVHVCLYFIPPHRLKEFDILFMKRLSERTLVIPVLAKADCYQPDELAEMKQLVASELEKNEVATFNNEVYAILSKDRSNIGSQHLDPFSAEHSMLFDNQRLWEELNSNAADVIKQAHLQAYSFLSEEKRNIWRVRWRNLNKQLEEDQVKVILLAICLFFLLMGFAFLLIRLSRMMEALEISRNHHY